MYGPISGTKICTDDRFGKIFVGASTVLIFVALPWNTPTHTHTYYTYMHNTIHTCTHMNTLHVDLT